MRLGGGASAGEGFTDAEKAMTQRERDAWAWGKYWQEKAHRFMESDGDGGWRDRSLSVQPEVERLVKAAKVWFERRVIRDDDEATGRYAVPLRHFEEQELFNAMAALLDAQKKS